jgi:DNA-binding CsgD family transcriptional regulator
MFQASPADRAVGAIYEAALDSSAWSAALAAVAQHLDASSATAIALDLTRNRVSFGALYHIDPANLEAYARYYVRIDLWNVALSELPARRPYYSQALVDEHTFSQSEFYNDFLRSQGIFHALGGFVLRSSSQVFLCGMQRDKSKAQFGSAEARRLARLFPHLDRAARLHGGLAAVGGLAEGLATALERMPQAALLVDPIGRVIWSNGLGEDQLRRADAIRLREGCIEAAGSTSLTQDLRRLIAGSAGLANAVASTTGGRRSVEWDGTRGDDLGGSPSPPGNGSRMGAGRNLQLAAMPRRSGRTAGSAKRRATPRQGLASPQIIRPPGEVAMDDIGGLVLLPRAWPLRPLMVTVTPLAPRQLSGSIVPGLPQAAALLLIHDPDRAVAMPPERLVRVYGLTPAEAKLAAALAGGASLGAYADNARITIGTARWYLKQVLAKTGAHRQSDLVRQVVMTAGAAAGQGLTGV